MVGGRALLTEGTACFSSFFSLLMEEKLILLIILPFQKMNDLYTFNSEQLRSITQQQRLTQKHTLFRKKILTLRDAKKLQIHLGSDAEEWNEGQAKGSRSVLKKVSFNQTNPSQVRESYSSQIPKQRSFNQQNLMVEANQLPVLPALSEREPQKSMEERRIVGRMVFRSFSAFKRPESERIKDDQMVEKQNQICRQKRILSLRMSPKIVLPLSDRKLPKAFRISLEDKGLRRSVNSECRNRKQTSKPVNVQSKSPSFLDQSLQLGSRFKKMLLMEKRFFQKLYMPTGY